EITVRTGLERIGAVADPAPGRADPPTLAHDDVATRAHVPTDSVTAAFAEGHAGRVGVAPRGVEIPVVRSRAADAIGRGLRARCSERRKRRSGQSPREAERRHRPRLVLPGPARRRLPGLPPARPR